jgi:hypothetical protein
MSIKQRNSDESSDNAKDSDTDEEQDTLEVDVEAHSETKCEIDDNMRTARDANNNQKDVIDQDAEKYVVQLQISVNNHNICRPSIQTTTTPPFSNGDMPHLRSAISASPMNSLLYRKRIDNIFRHHTPAPPPFGMVSSIL